MALALDAPQPLGRRVEIEGMHAEGLDESLVHLGGTYSLLVDIILSERFESSSELLLGQAHGHRRVGIQILWLEAVELRDNPLDRQREGQTKKAMDADTEGGRALAAHV